MQISGFTVLLVAVVASCEFGFLSLLFVCAHVNGRLLPH